MSTEPANAADFALASDLGRKVADDVGATIRRTFMLCETPYQREVVVSAAAAAATVFARTTLRLATPDVTDPDILEVLLKGLPGASQ
ncbi:hypothetical protein [Brevundimonas aurantiaca]|jgi:hypothetical protein|uniref:Uncharacterized protein n=1 Tax=Brevundimonas aurantiaca TaxID=74316 RepID=A0A7W9FB44_9CAUL|nr:hypothetical protein [Brevundimonas aurantiaca]MBB5741073.1 hypothetical protein [Brevundimonas aurantiaca]